MGGRAAPTTPACCTITHYYSDATGGAGFRLPSNIRGGKYVHSGSYGCTFAQPLAYYAAPEEHKKEPPGSDSPKIGKVMTRENANEEYAYAKRMLDIDPGQLYGIYPDMPPVRVVPETAAASAGGEGELAKCTLAALQPSLHSPPGAVIPEGEEAYQLVMQQALGDVTRVLGALHGKHTLTQVGVHMHALRNLYAGLDHMHAHRMCHLDIKPENVVVVGPSKEAPTAYKFIDFGLASSMSELVLDGARTALDYVYPAYPLVANVWWTLSPAFQAGAGGGGSPGSRRRLPPLVAAPPREPEEYTRAHHRLQREASRRISGRVSNAPPEALTVQQKQAQLKQQQKQQTQKQEGARQPFLSYTEDPFSPLLRARTAMLLESFKPKYFKHEWEPAFKTFSVVYEDNAAMLAAYHPGKNRDTAGAVLGGEARLAAARATDVYGLARVTAYVYACVAGVRFSEARVAGAMTQEFQTVAGNELQGLHAASRALGVLLADMMHLRIPDTAVLGRFDAVLALVDQALAAEEREAAEARELTRTYIDALKRGQAGAMVSGMSAQDRAKLQPTVRMWMQNAVQEGLLDPLHALLQSGLASPDTLLSDGLTALMSATEHGHAHCVAELLAAGAQVNAAMGNGWTALMSAANSGHAEALHALLAAGADSNRARSDGVTALMLAADSGYHAITSALLKAGAHPNATDVEGRTALFLAAASKKRTAGDRHDTVAALLQAGASANQRYTATGMTPLMACALNGDAAVARALLDAGADVAHVSAEGYAALTYAARNGNEPVVSALLASGADPDQGLGRVQTPLVRAAARGHASTVAALLAARARPDGADSTGRTALMHAAEFGHAPVVAVLLAGGAQVDAVDAGGATSLLLVAGKAAASDVLTLLLNAGADVNRADAEGWTPLLVAAESGSLAHVSALLNAGAKPGHAKPPQDWTPLCYAARRGHAGVASALLAAGARVDQAIASGLTAVMVAAESGHAELVTLLAAAGADVNKSTEDGWKAIMGAAALGHVGAVKALLAAGAAAATPRGGDEGKTAIMMAAEFGHAAIVAALAAAGARVDETDYEGRTALRLAADGGGHADVAEALLAAGASPHTVSEDGQCPLLVAAAAGHAAMVTVLLKAGASVNATDDNGRTALMHASEVGSVAMVAELLAAGADAGRRDSDGQTALVYAEDGRHSDVVNVLHAHGGANDKVYYQRPLRPRPSIHGPEV